MAGPYTLQNWGNATLTGCVSTLPLAIASNGGVVVGQWFNSLQTSHAFVWNNGAWTDLPWPAGAQSACAQAVNGDGLVIGGYYSTSTSSAMPCVWTFANNAWTVATLATLSGGTQGAVNDINADGTVLAGQSYNSSSRNHPVTWSGASYATVTDFGVPAAYTDAVANCISGDGSTIGGYLYNYTTGIYHGLVATSPTSFTDIAPLGSGDTCEIYDLTYSATMAVGKSNNAANGDTQAITWTSAGGLKTLPNITTPPGLGGVAYAVTWDGTVIVGQLFNNLLTAGYPVYWLGSAATGYTLLANPPGDTTYDADARDITADASVIVGHVYGGNFQPSSTIGVAWTGPLPQPFPGLGQPNAPPGFDVLTIVSVGNVYTPYWIERLTKQFGPTDSLADGWFLDGAAQATYVKDNGSGGAKLYGLWHLRNQTVTAVINGLDCGDYTVDPDGTLNVPYGSDPDGLFTSVTSSTVAIVGYCYTSQGQLLRPGNPQDAGTMAGPPLAKTRRGHQFGVLLNETVGPALSFGTEFATLYPAQVQQPNGTAYTHAELFTGVHWDSLDGSYDFDGMLCWQVIRPYPVTIAATNLFLHTQDR